jgi:asparagine synthase (glutamine-hydrolysing)
MCGIAGWWSFSQPLTHELNIHGLTSALSHRGPDGKSVVNLESDTLQLGHTRLSILDLSSDGNQPMPYADGKFYITFNGEIYNFIELRQELESFGHNFRTDTDTEVILAAYAEWGEDCQFKFNGMWAFAIWDAIQQKLFLSRDRFGVKPLFYSFDGQNFIFASELKAFMALPPRYKPEFDYRMVSLFTSLENTSSTLLKNVKNLNAGHSITLFRNHSPDIKQWWYTSDHLVPVPSRYSEQVEQYREIFWDACKIRMRSDVPVGTALSGGMDSSSVICAMAQIQNRNNSGVAQRQASDWRKAFVLDYLGTAHSERHYAQEVIDYVEAAPNFKEITLEEIDPQDVVKSIFALEAIQEPGLGPWLIYRQMRSQGIVVSLDGHGGDEQLAGYHSYCKPAFRDALWRWRGVGSFADIQQVYQELFGARELPEGLASTIPPSRLGFLLSTLRPELTQVFTRSLKSNQGEYDLLRRIKHHIRGSSLPIHGRSGSINYLTQSPVKDSDCLNQALYSDFHYGTLPTILRNFDRLSMAHGVEIRAPFLDYRLVNYAFSLPSSTKMGNGFTKRILRDAMNGFMPESIRIRKSKIGFASPMQAWIEKPLKSLILDVVHSQSFIESPIWDGVQIRDQITLAYETGLTTEVRQFWCFVQAYILMQSFNSFAVTSNLRKQ